MSKEIDWSKAPEGATHWVGATELWHKHIGDISWYWQESENKWRQLSIPADQVEEEYRLTIVKRPEDKWTGQGLPPVGTVCEVLWNESRLEYLKAKVFGVNEHGQPIFRFEEGPKKFEYQADPLRTLSGTPVFRPIRTPEQIAAEEREKAIDEICYDICFHFGNPKGSEKYLNLATTLYDAGYRKTEAAK